METRAIFILQPILLNYWSKTLLNPQPITPRIMFPTVTDDRDYAWFWGALRIVLLNPFMWFFPQGLEQFSNRHAVSRPQLRTLWGPCVYLQSLFKQLSLLCYCVLWILAPLPLLLSKLCLLNSRSLLNSTSVLSLPWSLKATICVGETWATVGFYAFIFQFLLLNVQYMKNPFFPCSSDWKFISICIQLWDFCWSSG